MLGDRDLNFDQYLDILKRRIWWIALPTLLVPGLVYLGSLLISNQYTSQTLVLVEQQKVPDNFVKPVVTEELNERLATMQEQILSRTRLQPLIERFSLFPSDMGKVPMEDLVDRMRKLISVTAVRADFGTRTGGLPGFYISFTGREPHVAQQVCSEITSMFMQENLLAREQSAQGTTEFLSSQLDDAKRKLDDQDAKLAGFKQKYLGQLPEQEQTNLSVLGALNTQLDGMNQALARAQQDQAFAESLLADRLAAWKAAPAGKEDPEDLRKKLSDLESQLSLLDARYTSDYPDVIKTKSEIVELKKKLNAKPVAESATSADKSATDTDKSTTNNDKSAKDAGKSAPDKDKPAAAESPEIRQLRLQIHEQENLKFEKAKEQERLQQQIRAYQSRVQMSPLVEEQYKALTRDHQAALNFYNELLAKETQSAMATDLEKKQQGEQFKVMDAPNLPEKPTWPDRQKFALGGLAGGIGLGFGLAFFLEMRDKTLRTDEDVLFYLKLPVLTDIPTVSPNGNGKGTKDKVSTEKAARSSQDKAKV
jgi:polysaccharide chain length determinant protein (PEP-CTERM system associated)